MSNKIIPWIPEAEYVAIFRSKIIRWYDKHKRIYPWRTTRNPFRVLIAEMMLRRTRADQVKMVYDKLFADYPDIKALSKAGNKKMRKILYPLGLKWRAPAFGMVVREVMEKYKCKVPETRKELKSLPGVGEYVAGAVLSIAYGKKEWIVDSNIVRLFKRYFGIKTSKEGRRDKHVIKMARMYVSCKNPRNANLAILDFTALVCKPRGPQCTLCPLINACCYFPHLNAQRGIAEKRGSVYKTRRERNGR